MTTTQSRTTYRRTRVRWGRVAGLLAVAVGIFTLGHELSTSSAPTVSSSTVARRVDLSNSVWPPYGQAAVQLGESQIKGGPNQHPVPIASVAKVMTAYLVLRDHPLRRGEDGPVITLTEADVADTERRRRREESLISIVSGEQLTELQALQALLLPSANNIAAALARWDAGSESRFVARMNATARALGMRHTRYTDPSGYDDATVSTAVDQLRVVGRAMRLPVFAHIVATTSATVPVAGTIHNTNTLLGRDGFVGVKTGSDEAAGGCFAFRAIRVVHGTRTTITGVVLGQPGEDRIAAGLAAADELVARITGDSRGHGRAPAPSPPPARASASRDARAAAGSSPPPVDRRRARPAPPARAATRRA